MFELLLKFQDLHHLASGVQMTSLVPIEETGYEWPTDPALIDPITCSQFWDCDGHENNVYEKKGDYYGWWDTDQSTRPFAGVAHSGGRGSYTGAF
eukprot:CAMPEP_0113697998 /NCGR_PEP_ID=MMETSP0038_2-20120614/22459_1 /TAXON_ID=2898 /ORGANISM="Cryptomonas paramecium" /LENGTH=94 /DNA_ID=CAMNT_0000621099 /DNA_START=6 /DNA_END=290 /DNA_ORIENTATION=- /assembly_acc=CAM_ASM_000170